jgi:hypothetical protein
VSRYVSKKLGVLLLLVYDDLGLRLGLGLGLLHADLHHFLWALDSEEVGVLLWEQFGWANDEDGP